MNPSLRILLGSAAYALALAGVAARAHAGPAGPAALTATGGYDPATATLTNNVDFNALNIPITVGTGNGAAAPGGAFNSFIATAFAAGRGGVVDFDGLSTATGFFGMNVSYAGGTKSLHIATSGLFQASTGFAVEDGAPTSGTQYGEALGTTSFTFTFGAITGASPGETGVRAAGITLLSGNSAPSTPFPFGLVTVTGQFSDNSTFSASRTINELKGEGDTFFSVVAPANLTISSLTFSPPSSPPGATLPEFDDLAFATAAVPEPATWTLLALALPALLGLRRNKSSPKS